MKILAVVLSLFFILICIQNTELIYLVVLKAYIPLPTYVLLLLGIVIGAPIGRYSIRHF